MIEGLEPLVSHYEQEGARRFSRWDGALFRTLVEWPGQTLCGRLPEQPGSEAVFEAFVRLLVEAIGCGYVGPDSLAPPGAGRRAPRNLIELFFLDLIPARLGGGSGESQVAILARAWNLGEGLLGEPAWMNRAVAGAMASLDSLADLDRKLVRVLEAALVVRAPSTLAGPFTTRTVDTKEFDNAFLLLACRRLAGSALGRTSDLLAALRPRWIILAPLVSTAGRSLPARTLRDRQDHGRSGTTAPPPRTAPLDGPTSPSWTPPERREAASGRAITAAPGHPIATEEERMRTSRLAQEWNRVDPRGSRWSRLSPRSRSLPTPGGERAGELRRRAFGHEVARIVRR